MQHLPQNCMPIQTMMPQSLASIPIQEVAKNDLPGIPTMPAGSSVPKAMWKTPLLGHHDGFNVQPRKPLSAA